MKGLLGYACILLILSSCGSKKDKGSGPKYIETDLSVKEVLDRSKLKCKDTGCPDEVVKIVFDKGEDDKGKNKIGLCSGFLVDEYTVMTNGHCIPQYLLDMSKSCDQMIGVKTQEGETRFCSKIIKIEFDEEAKQDFAVFRLKNKIDVNKINISKSGVKNGTNIVGFVVDHPVYLEEDSLIRKIDCKTRTDSLLSFSDNGDFSNSFTIADESIFQLQNPCYVIKGNSGSAMLSSDLTHLVGVVSHTFDMENLKEYFLKYGTMSDSMFSEFGIMTSLSCIGKILGGNDKNKNCLSIQKLRTKKKETDTDFINNSNTAIAVVENDLPGREFLKWQSLVDYSDDYKKDSYSFYIKPICVDIESIHYKDAKQNTNNNFIEISGKLKEGRYVYYAYDYWLRIKEFKYRESKKDTSLNQDVNFKINWQELENDEKTKIVFPNDKEASRFKKNLEVSVCH